MARHTKGTPESPAGAEVGCQHCLQGDLGQTDNELQLEVPVFDGNHEGLLLMRCSRCRIPVLQHWLEFVDWNDRWGGDQFWIHWTPLTEAERQVLRDTVGRGEQKLAERLARSLSKSRRHLTKDPESRRRWKEGPDASDILPPC
ncbi:MAG: hypothetical protein EA422_13600 [Gemmatimonadales bacterium]|nr:MAG: hypothetical protein EA422_13600 [Gemmatimonadales bacterium]